jgi:Nif-specific regulatory protein
VCWPLDLPAIVQDIDAEPLVPVSRRGAIPSAARETVAFIALPIEVNVPTVGVLACHRIRSRQRHLNDDMALLRVRWPRWLVRYCSWNSW